MPKKKVARAVIQVQSDATGQRNPLDPMLVPLDGLLRLAQLTELIPLSAQTFIRWSKEGRFPPPVTVTGLRFPMWRASDVRAWIESGGAREAA